MAPSSPCTMLHHLSPVTGHENHKVRNKKQSKWQKRGQTSRKRSEKHVSKSEVRFTMEKQRHADLTKHCAHHDFHTCEFPRTNCIARHKMNKSMKPPTSKALRLSHKKRHKYPEGYKMLIDIKSVSVSWKEV